ncbi:MAG: DMT family transporter, partial [Actinomycetota bacterium]|nr:DMT family transporter [Actinomycetota bacterium]
MSFLLLLPLAFIGGMAVPAQFAVNSQLKNVVGGTFSAAAVSFIVGAVALSLGALVVSRTVPQFSEMAGAPWWVWTGGLLG